LNTLKNKIKMSIRVRFAPSPTGALHIGGIRTALYNYLLAKKHGGTFVLRIEDTDQTRFVDGAEDYIIEALKWCGIAPTEGIGFGDGDYAPYRQSERKDLYKKYADQLIANGHAYYAFDTPEELETMRERLQSASASNQSYSMVSRSTMKNSLTLSAEAVKNHIESGKPYVIRLKVVENQVVTIDDIIRGEVNFNTNELDDKVLMKADGMPTYHLANIVDDYLMKITHVIRGEEWLPSAGHHALIYKAFGWEADMPRFSHLPLILKPDGKGKLSKRDGKKFGFPVFPLGWKGATEEDSFEGFRELGFDPRAVINFLVVLGWNSGTEQEIFSMDELVDTFSLEKINNSGARFDFEKAKWFNQQYIMATPNDVLAEQLYPLSIAKGYKVSKDFLSRFAGLMKERVVFFNEFLEKGYYFFQNVEVFDNQNITKRWKPDSREKFEALRTFISSLDFTDPLSMESAAKEWINENGLKMGEVLPLLRIALAGTMQGPAVFEMAALLGKEEVASRLGIAYDYFDKL
jgi:glutamyl-tRNA synthetase